MKTVYTFSCAEAHTVFRTLGIKDPEAYDPVRRHWPELLANIQDRDISRDRDVLPDYLEEYDTVAGYLEDGHILSFDGRTGTIVMDYSDGFDRTIELHSVLGMLRPDARDDYCHWLVYDADALASFVENAMPMGRLRRTVTCVADLKNDTIVLTIEETAHGWRGNGN